jgi:general stress protein YciG
MNHDTIPNSTPTASTSTEATPQPPPAPRPKQRRGFAAMDPRLVAEIASKGGKAAHAAGTAHEFTSDEARAAGRKGGLAPHTKRRANSEPKNPV